MNVSFGQRLWYGPNEASTVERRVLLDYLDTDNSGEIDVHELAQLAPLIGEQWNSDYIQSLMCVIDADGNGRISFEEFEALHNGNNTAPPPTCPTGGGNRGVAQHVELKFKAAMQSLADLSGDIVDEDGKFRKPSIDHRTAYAAASSSSSTSLPRRKVIF